MSPGAQFGQAADDASAPAPDDPGTPEYNFEGYSVEFLEKVALLPVADTAPSGTAR